MSSKKSGFSIFLGISLSLFCIGGAVWLLLIEKLAGAEFVALVLGGIVLSLIIYFSSEIQEFSIAGNAVKLRELKNEAHQTIESLKQARTELFRLMLPQVLKEEITFGNVSHQDERIDAFNDVYSAIKSFSCVIELKADIQDVLTILIIDQFNKLKFIHENPFIERKNIYANNFWQLEENLERLWTPQQLSLKLTEEMINNETKFTISPSEFMSTKEDIHNAIHAYAKLYIIYKELMSLQNHN